MNKIRISFLLLIFISAPLSAQYNYMFRLQLADKGISSFTVNHPQEFLTQRAIDRRIRQNIPVDISDLPISTDYISQIESKGCKVVAKSKWLKSVSVLCSDSTSVENIEQLPFITNITFVWKGIISGLSNGDTSKKTGLKTAANYGPAYQQIAIHNGDYLHDSGYKGEGMEIAVIDAGFTDFNQNLLLSTVNIKGSKDFVYNGGDMFKSSGHGISVLSCMGTNAANEFTGTAPKASYWLLRSEDARSEYPIEEDYWVAAAEYADSVGVDLINVSLGYSTFDYPAKSYTYSQMDGKTAFITQGAEMAVAKGIFVVSSAGNEGDKTWKYISAPADGKYVFTVGAIRKDLTIAAFSSRGSTADGRIKPDVMAVGQSTSLVNQAGGISSGDGTSFSTPIMCGLVACLWQANPLFTNKKIADIIRQSADRYNAPDNDYGYGIPDMKKAMEIAQNSTSIMQETIEKEWLTISTDNNRNILITKDVNDQLQCNIYIYTIAGKIILTKNFFEKETIFKLNTEQKGVYLVRIEYKNMTKTLKICI